MSSFCSLKGVRALRGLIWPPLEPKTENCFSPISFVWFIRRKPAVLFFRIYSTFTVAMVTKMADKNRLKIEKFPFWTKFKALQLGNRFFLKKTLHISTDKYPKKLLICCVLYEFSSSDKIVLGPCLCSMLIFQSNVSNSLQFPIFSLFWRPFLLP